MILTSTWERYVDYPLVFLGAAIVAAWLLRGARWACLRCMPSQARPSS